MPAKDDRRNYERRLLGEDMYCYIDGARLDAASLDISQGGLFLTTVQDIPMGAVVALVFKLHQRVGSPPVYMVGRVVRKQTEPYRGIGLHWLKAVAEHTESLEQFLTELLGMTKPIILSEGLGPLGEDMAVHYFPDVPAHSESAIVGTVPDSNSLAPTSPEPGPMTLKFKDDEQRAPADVDACLKVGDLTATVRVINLGRRAIFARSAFVPIAVEEPLEVQLTIPRKGGSAILSCNCRVVHVHNGDESDPPGLEMRILSVDEGNYAGLLERYLRYLRFKALTETESES